MGKRDKIHTLARLIALAVAHRIGVLLDLHSTYANKYRKECANFIRQAENTQWGEHWSSSDKKEILETAKKESLRELAARTYLAPEKFKLLEKEILYVMHELKIL